MSAIRACCFIASFIGIALSPLHAEPASSNEDPLLVEQFFGHDDRGKITDIDNGPWDAIGQIETESGNLCTATLITPKIVLTAGHCLLRPPHLLDKAVALRFPTIHQQWRYNITRLRTYVPPELGERLKPREQGWIVPPSAAALDYGIIEITQGNLPRIKPIPLWHGGSPRELLAALKQANRQVTQAGYPQDHLNDLYSHTNCLIMGWAQNGVLNHQCDTLPGDSGSPLLLKTPDGWQLIAIQSSAPAPEHRWQADNRAVAVTAFYDDLQRFIKKQTTPPFAQ